MTDEKKDLEAASKPPATIAEFFPTSLEELGINEKQLAFFKRTIAPALLDSEIVYLFIRAKKLGLDPIKSEICCIPHNTKIKKVGGGEEWVRVPTIIVEIGGLRKLAAERGRYIPGSVFLNTDNENNVHSATANCSFLAADGKWHPACYTVYMKEAMDTESPTWKRRPYGQLMKCAEAALIRYLSKVLDTDLSGVYEEAETAFINYEPHPKIEDKTDVFNALKSHHILPEMVCKKFGKASEEEMTKTDMLALKQVLAKIRIGEIDPIEYFGMIDMPQPEPAPEPPAEPEDVPAPMKGDYPPNHIPPDTTGMAEEVKKHIAKFPPKPPQESQPQVATTKDLTDIVDKLGEKSGLNRDEVSSVISKGKYNDYASFVTDNTYDEMILAYAKKKGVVK